MRTLQLWAKQAGLNCAKGSLSLTFDDISPEEFEAHLAAFKEEVDAAKLAELMPKKQAERFDRYVDERLLDKANSEYRLNLAGAVAATRRTLEKTEWVPPLGKISVEARLLLNSD